jgi:hypothetical protein
MAGDAYRCRRPFENDRRDKRQTAFDHIASEVRMPNPELQDGKMI